jgi:glycosyltransferase involved in cell wall biosynthesis
MKSCVTTSGMHKPMDGLSILFINSTKRASGGEYWMARVGAEFVSRGHQVAFICKPRQPWAEDARTAGVDVFEHGLHGDINLAAVARLALLVSKRKIDLICTVFDREVRLAGMANKLFPSVSLVHRKVIPRVKDRFQYKASYRYLVDKIITPSHSIETALTRHRWFPPSMVEVVPNGIDISPFNNLNPSRRLRESLDIPRGRVIVGTIADLVRAKGHDLLLESIPSILLLTPDVHFLFVGEGPLETKLRQKAAQMGISDRITFAGFRRDIPEILRHIDVFVLPSRSEGASLAVLEAMAAGRPVVVSDVGGNSELVIHGLNGFLFPRRDPVLLAEQVALLVVNPRLRRKMGLEGRKWVEREFTLDRMITRLESVFQRTVREKRHGKKSSRKK